jgi:hypothetical protein
VGCAEVQKSTNTIIVSSSEMNGKQYPEEMLPGEIIGRLPTKVWSYVFRAHPICFDK